MSIVIKRDFDLDCVFLMSEILDKMDLGVDADNIIKKTQLAKLENMKDASKFGKEIAVGIGVEMASKIVRNLYKAKNEVKNLIGELTGQTPDEVQKMNLKDIKGFFSELVKHEGFADFLSQAEELTE